MKKIIIFLLLLPAVAGYAQVKNLRFYHLSLLNGETPIGDIYSMLQDKYGYVWIAGNNQLVRYDGYRTKIYLTKLGPAWHGGANILYQDHEGVLWAGTRFYGLMRYDRAADTFQRCVYYPGDSGANAIDAIQEDGSENIWAISENQNGTIYLNCFNKKTGKWHHFSKSDTGNYHLDANISDLYADREGHIWLTSNNGIYEYDSAVHRFVGYLTSKDSTQQKTFYFLYEASSEPGFLWMAKQMNKNGSGGGILRFNIHDHSFTIFRHKAGDTASIETDSAEVIQEDKEGRLWIHTIDGLSLFHPKTGEFTNYPIPGKKASWVAHLIFRVKEDKMGNFWCETPGGLFYFNTQTKVFSLCPTDANDAEALQDNPDRLLMMDSTGTLWASFGFEVQWINRERSRFTIYQDKGGIEKGYKYGSVNSFAQAADGSFWLGTDKGLIHWNPVTNSFISVKLVAGRQTSKYIFAKPDAIQTVFIDEKGTIWCGGDYGLFRYNPVSGSIKQYQYSKKDTTTLSNNLVSCIYEDTEGTIWIGTFSGGLCSLNPKTGKITRFPYTSDNSFALKPNNKKLIGSEVSTIYEDRQGTLWIGTSQSISASGLNRFNRSDSTFTFFRNASRGFLNVISIIEDKNGFLWIGSWAGGLIHFNPKTGSIQQQFTKKDGLLINTIYGNLQDSLGRFWLISPGGITLFNPKTDSAHRITTDNGLPSVKFTYDAAYKTMEGNFLLGTSNGFMEFNPNQFIPNPYPPIMHIQTVSFTKPQRGNKSSEDSTLVVFGHSKFNFHYNENRITFHYAGIHYQNAAMTQYAYKLDGYDKSWIQAGTERSVTYTNLSPGAYTFWVKAANSDGVWSKPTSIAIIISPPWWETWWAYIIYAIIIIAIVWGLIAYRSRNLKKKNQQLEQKVSQRTNELQQSLENLKSTQKQLIQSEKMASLGELTAGIAHEIQNPLNFVNNFSEVNRELIVEMKGELAKGNGQLATDIANDIDENEEKIIHHGKRADAIVKGMLQHSRISSGKKEPTNINALADEYFRLSYHGMRAKDKSFNATMKTDFDESVGRINVVPQDIGRVFLNLFNNAFYAAAPLPPEGGFKDTVHKHEPTVWVSTKRITDVSSPPEAGRPGGAIEIRVKDNGNGIPEKIKDKIFQPFFTTKPTGEGTGLGLSLSYDMVKAHGGEITVNSKEGEGTEFVVVLPG